MKLFAILATSTLGQYQPYPDGDGYDAGYADEYPNYGKCGPSAAEGGAYWPSLSAEHPCGVQFWSDQVSANSKCQLQLNAGASYFLTLGGVFVTSPASDYYADTFYFHTYDNWQGAMGASVTNFWQNADFPSNASCHDADAICITCTEEPDLDYDGYPDMVQGVYLGNFMHDFRHAAPSRTNVPIANSAGHQAGTIYDIQLMDQYGNAVPITKISSHYMSQGHMIDAPQYDNGDYYASDGKFSIHVGCTEFLGQFLYFQFQHEGDMEANGWYSWVTARSEVLDCEPAEPAAAYPAAPAYPDHDHYQDGGYPDEGAYPANSVDTGYAAPAYPEAPAYPAAPGYPEVPAVYPNGKPKKPKKPKGQRPNKNNMERTDYLDFNNTDYVENVDVDDIYEY